MAGEPLGQVSPAVTIIAIELEPDAARDRVRDPIGMGQQGVASLNDVEPRLSGQPASCYESPEQHKPPERKEAPIRPGAR